MQRYEDVNGHYASDIGRFVKHTDHLDAVAKLKELVIELLNEESVPAISEAGRALKWCRHIERLKKARALGVAIELPKKGEPHE